MSDTLTSLTSSDGPPFARLDRKSTRLNSSHMSISYAVFCLKKKKTQISNKFSQACTTAVVYINARHTFSDAELFIPNLQYISTFHCLHKLPRPIATDTLHIA